MREVTIEEASFNASEDEVKKAGFRTLQDWQKAQFDEAIFSAFPDFTKVAETWYDNATCHVQLYGDAILLRIEGFCDHNIWTEYLQDYYMKLGRGPAIQVNGMGKFFHTEAEAVAYFRAIPPLPLFEACSKYLKKTGLWEKFIAFSGDKLLASGLYVD